MTVDTGFEVIHNVMLVDAVEIVTCTTTGKPLEGSEVVWWVKKS